MAERELLEAFISLRPALLRYLALRGARTDEAEDVLQDTSMVLATGAIASIEHPKAYIYRMVHNRFLLHRRTESRRVGREEAWFDVNSGDPPEIDQQPSAEINVMARQQLELLQRVIDRMPERTRTIFQRFRIDNVPQRQIAADIGVSVSAVEKHLAIAYAAIADARIRFDEDRTPARGLSSRRDRDG